MKYWHVHAVVAEYSDPVEMLCEIMEMLTAPDVFGAKFQDLTRLQVLSRQVDQVCHAAKESKIKNLKASIFKRL